MTRISSQWLMNVLGNPSKTNSGPKKSNKISGTWKITGSVIRPWDLEKTDRSFNLLPFNRNLIIKQDETSNYCMAYFEQDKTDKNELKPDVGYQPAVLTDIFSNKLELIVPDYDDNGTFRFAETQRDINGEVSEFQGIYVEAGYVGTLLQVPTTGSFTLKKINTDDTVNEPPRVAEKQKHIRIVPGEQDRDGSLYYNINEMYKEYLTPLGLKYTIRYTGAIYNKNNEVIGKIVVTNDYAINKGTTTCNFTNDYIIYKTTDTSLDYAPTDVPYAIPEGMPLFGRFITKGTFQAFTERDTQFVGSNDETVVAFSGFKDYINIPTEESTTSGDMVRNNNKRGSRLLEVVETVVDAVVSPIDEATTIVVDLIFDLPPTNNFEKNSNGGVNTNPWESMNRALKWYLEKNGLVEGVDFFLPPSPGKLVADQFR